MSSKMNTKLRLVRCPKCRNVLPEPPEVPVYECGGCGAVLQAKKRKNDTVDTTSQKLEEDPSGKQKTEQGFNDQEAGSSSNHIIDGPDRKLDHNEIVDHKDSEPLTEPTVHTSINQDQNLEKGKLKMVQLSDDQEACSSSNQQLLVNSIYERDRSNDHNDPRSSTELSGHEDPQSSPEAIAHSRIDQDQQQERDQEEDHHQNEAKKQEKDTVNATSGELDHSSREQKVEQVSDDQEADISSDKNSTVNLIDNPNRKNHHNEPRCSSELSCHEDSESSPEAPLHNRMDQVRDHDHDEDQDHEYDQEQGMFMISKGSENHKNRDEYEESSRELTESPEKCSYFELNEIEEPPQRAITNTKIIRDSDGGSKSSFKSLIAEKLLDTRQRKTVYIDEDETLSEDGSADLCHRRRFERISSLDTLENAQFGGTNYYGYEGSESSFDENKNQNPRKNRNVLKSDQHHRRSHEFHPSKSRWEKDEIRSNPRHRPPVVPVNAKMERIELLKMVQELQDQLERTNVTNNNQQVDSYSSYYDRVLNHPMKYGQRMAFSGEGLGFNRLRDDTSCHRCRQQPQERHFSAQLPREHHVCCNGPHYGPNTYYNSHFSGPSSPRPEPEVYRVRNDGPKKRYVRPIAGGSPWISCYRCSEVLQLPQSFLVFKKRCHSLRCGGCLKVLNFTVSNGSHVHRYYPEETIAAPPCSEVEDYGPSTESRAGPVSCSDRSFQKSYSTETDRYGWHEFSEERKKAGMSRDPSGSTRPSSSRASRRRNTTSEIEEVEPASNGSPLHWLMGYASPSKVIRG